MGSFACMHNGPLKEGFYSVLSCCINSYLTPLFLVPHPEPFSFRYGIEYVLIIWKGLG